jgi:hypothetical protein
MRNGALPHGPSYRILDSTEAAVCRGATSGRVLKLLRTSEATFLRLVEASGPQSRWLDY